MTITINELYLAATLLAYGATLEDIDHTDPRRKRFTFSMEGEVKEIWVLSGNSILRVENPDFEMINTKFAAGTLVFPPNFVDSIRKIKSVIYGV
jgi:hypothetical protein